MNIKKGNNSKVLLFIIIVILLIAFLSCVGYIFFINYSNGKDKSINNNTNLNNNNII